MKFHFKKTEPFPGVSVLDWASPVWQFRHSLKTRADFAAHFDLTPDELNAFARQPEFQVRSTPYYAGLASRTDPRDAIRQMIVPQVAEFSSGGQQLLDPLGERQHSPLERIIHRYPDRVLFLVTDQCSVYCRYCLRKHFTGQDQAFVDSKNYPACLDYLRQSPGVREVILSGGDPLTLSDSRLERVLFDLRAIEHIEIIRIGTRMPVVCPMRMGESTVQLLRKFKPVYVMTHFNHPHELSFEAAEALENLVDHGVPVFNQMVLLRGINNHPAVVQALSRRLLFLRVKPYYMFQCDPSPGTDHFRISVDESLAIQRELWGNLSGLAMPHLSLDIPGGGGKVPLVPNFEIKADCTHRQYEGWDGIQGAYENPAGARSVAPSDIESYISEWQEIKQQNYGAKEPQDAHT